MWDVLDRLADHLFGSSAPADGPRERWLARYLALAGVLALIVFVRRPDAIRNAEFWAEDGSVFFAEQLTLGFWSALGKGFVGFPCLVQRLIAALAALVPIRWIPLAYNASAIAIAALAMATFSLPGFRHLVRRDALRVAVGLAAVCMPAGEELFGNVMNLEKFLAVWLVFLSVMRSPRTPAAVAGWSLGAAAAVFSTPIAPVVAPLCALRALHGLRQRRAFDLVFAATATASLLAVILWTGTLGADVWTLPGGSLGAQIGGSWASDLWWTLRALVWLVAATVDGMLLPARTFDRLEALGALPVVALALVIAAGIALAFRDLEERGRVTLGLAIYLFGSSLALVLAGRHLLVLLLRLPPHLNPHLSYRHRAFSNVAFLIAVAAMVDGARRVRTRIIAASVACLGLLFAWGPEFRLPPFPDLQWPLWAARLEEKLAAGSRQRFVIPSHPQQGFQIVIDWDSSGSRSAAPRDRSPPPSP
jgi:hypothetical protein